jgi:hypothetical protein
LRTSAFIASGKSGPTGPLAIATARVDFGDSTAGTVSQDCASPSLRLTLHHVYKTAGAYKLAVTSATLCDPRWQLSLDSGEGIRVLPAASASSADWPACTTSQLDMTDGGTGVGLGNVGTLIRLTNVSNAGCNLMGYPGLQLVSAAGTLLPTHVRLATDGDYLFPAIAVGRVALEPGAVAAFQVGYTDNPSGSAANEPYAVACPPARWVRVILPRTQQSGTAPVPMAPCEGNLNISPIFPGRDRIDFP